MNRRTAKVFRSNQSLAVVLPKDWCQGMEIEAGMSVEIEYDETVRIIALPYRKEVKKR